VVIAVDIIALEAVVVVEVVVVVSVVLVTYKSKAANNTKKTLGLKYQEGSDGIVGMTRGSQISVIDDKETS